MQAETQSAQTQWLKAEYERLDEARAENGAGLGASHQTGWTGVIGYLMKIAALVTPEAALNTESAYSAIQVEPHHPTST